MTQTMSTRGRSEANTGLPSGGPSQGERATHRFRLQSLTKKTHTRHLYRPPRREGGSLGLEVCLAGGSRASGFRGHGDVPHRRGSGGRERERENSSRRFQLVEEQHWGVKQEVLRRRRLLPTWMGVFRTNMNKSQTGREDWFS